MININIDMILILELDVLGFVAGKTEKSSNEV